MSGRAEGRGAGGWVPLLLLLSLVWTALPARAHELGTIQVTATFRQGGTWQVDVAIDEEHIPKLPARRPAGATRFGPIAGLTPELRARLGVFLSALADGSTLAFDGHAARPQALAVNRPAPPADDPFAPPPKVTLHLQGEIPPGSRAAAFQTTVPVGRYPAGFLNEGEAIPSRRWQASGEPGQPFPLSPRVVPPSRLEVLARYLGLGFRRVLPLGAEPILFLLGMGLLSLRLCPFLAQGIAFAAASGLAITASALGGIPLPPRLLGPALALSLLALGVENLLTREPGRLRIALVSAWGLLHGLALSGAFRSAGPPQTLRATALSGFDLGAVAGELAVLAAAFLLLGAPYRDRPWYRQRVVIPASLALATLGLYWSVERIFPLLPV
jgi:HupE/UreJ protein